MELKDLLDLHEKLESRINAYWTYWSFAIFGIAGWLFSGKQTFSPEQANGISIAVIVFFFANLGVLWPATRLATGVRDEIRLKTKEVNFHSNKLSSAFAEDSIVFRLQLTFGLHLAVDCVVVWALLNVCDIPNPTFHQTCTKAAESKAEQMERERNPSKTSTQICIYQNEVNHPFQQNTTTP